MSRMDGTSCVGRSRSRRREKSRNKKVTSEVDGRESGAVKLVRIIRKYRLEIESEGHDGRKQGAVSKKISRKYHSDGQKTIKGSIAKQEKIDMK